MVERRGGGRRGACASLMWLSFSGENTKRRRQGDCTMEVSRYDTAWCDTRFCRVQRVESVDVVERHGVNSKHAGRCGEKGRGGTGRQGGFTYLPTTSITGLSHTENERHVLDVWLVFLLSCEEVGRLVSSTSGVRTYFVRQVSRCQVSLSLSLSMCLSRCSIIA